MLWEIVETSVKHDINEINSNQTLTDSDSHRNLTTIDRDPKTRPTIQKFPAEFKKNFLKSIEVRFLVIFLVSLVFNVGLVFLLQRIVPMEPTSKEISHLQERFAKILLKEGYPPYPSPLDRPSKFENRIDPEVITGLHRWMSTFTTEFLETLAEKTPATDAAKGHGFSDSKETSLPPREDLLGARSAASGQRQASRSELEHQVSSVGLLGLISSNTRAIDREYVEDLLEYASDNSNHLGEVLSRLSAIEVPRYGSAHSLKRLQSDDDSGEALGLKGGRATAAAEKQQAIEKVKPIESVQAKPIKRNLDFEALPSSEKDQSSVTQAKAKTRSAQDVMRVVQSHTRALQDCYKQELRYAPQISGKITIRFIVDPDGNVKDASLISSTLNSPRMEECIINRIKRWRDFPACDPSVGDKTYRQTFSFGEKD